MTKRKFAILLCLSLTVAVALFGSTVVMAYEGSLVVPVNTCTMETLCGAPTLIIVDVDRPDNHTWIYNFSNISSRSNQIVTLVPVCNPELTYLGTPAPDLRSPGYGDPTTSFGFGDFQFRVFRVTPILNGSDGRHSITSKTIINGGRVIQIDVGNRATSLQLKSGSQSFYCKNISGPSCPEVSATSTLHSTCENVRSGFDPDTGLPIPLDNPFSIKTTINDSNCELTVSVYPGLDCTGNPTTVNASTMTLNLGNTLFDALECGSENQRCPICELRGHNNPCSITKYSSGRPYTVCFDCSTGVRLPCP